MIILNYETLLSGRIAKEKKKLVINRLVGIGGDCNHLYSHSIAVAGSSAQLATQQGTDAQSESHLPVPSARQLF